MGNNGMDDDAARTALLKSLLHQALEGQTGRTMTLEPAHLAQRELPPGNWSQLYMLYQAHCIATGGRCASKAAFYSASKVWRKTLRFRHQSKHSTCWTCDRLRAEMRASRGFMEHATACDGLLRHLAQMWRCRQAYWLAREKSRTGQGFLTIIYDGFDKSKPSLLRWPRGRMPKHATLERLNRTGIQISAALAHGYGAVIFLAEECVSTGGPFSWECLFYTIQKSHEACCRSGRSWPRSLWLQHDNTVKELKNGLSGNLLAGLVLSQYFDEAGQHMLPVGHTHEDIDGVFGMLSNHLMSANDSLQTLSDMKRLLGIGNVRRFDLSLRLVETKLGPVFMERNEFLEVVVMDRVRPWRDLVPSVATLSNAYRPRKDDEDKIPHSFTFCLRCSSFDRMVRNHMCCIVGSTRFRSSAQAYLPTWKRTSEYLDATPMATMMCSVLCGIICVTLTCNNRPCWFFRVMRRPSSTGSGMTPTPIQGS